MLFKLSIHNMKKSFKDYTIYFLTLVLGVAIFYIFNSLDSQTAMLEVSQTAHELIDLMMGMLSGVSVFVSIILGFLIVYANNFLIKRRKKEFGIYMTLGMGKRSISKILVCETLLIGILSLGVGLILGIFGSQFMSVLVTKLFQSDMSEFIFTFSSGACIKTMIYFGIMYLLVMIFNTFTISRYKLIDLLNASKHTEKVKLKSTWLSVILFIVSILLLSFAYYKVTQEFTKITQNELMAMIALGAFSTFLFFWSLSGFILKLVQSCKKVYLKELNMFVLRQTNAKINTTVCSMTIICLMLFLTIVILSAALSTNYTLQNGMAELTPVDFNAYKTLDLSGEDYYGNAYSEKRIEDSKISVAESFEKAKLDMSIFKDVVEVTTYAINDITMQTTLGEVFEEIKQEFPTVDYDIAEEIITVSEYNKVARLYHLQEFSVEENEYIVLCDYQNMKQIRDKALELNTTIRLKDKTYYPKYQECQDGFITMSSNHINMGIIIVPDNAPLTENDRVKNYFLANYNATTDKEKHEVENMILSDSFEQNLTALDSDIDAVSKITIYEAAIGIGAMVTFIAIYLGIIFLISSAAILALKELSESSDNKERYDILRKIGTDEKMIHKALFLQIGIFFILPLLLAMVHSIFGLQFATKILSTFDNIGDLTLPIILTAIFIILIYGGYFLATYFGSKNIIKECNY